MENTINQILRNVNEWGHTSSIRREDIPLFVYEMLYVIYSSRENNYELKIDETKNIFELINQAIGINDKVKDSNKFQLLLDIENDLAKFKYVELDYVRLFKMLQEVDNNMIKEIVKVDLSEKFGLGYGSRGEFSTPIAINLLSRHLLDIKDRDNVLDMCSGVGSFLTEIASNCNTSFMTGVDINPQSALISKIRLSILTGKEDIIKITDALTYEYGCKYDKIFCNYPFGLRIDNYKLGEIKNKKDLFYPWGNYAGGSSDWLFVNNVISLLETNGKAIMIMPDGPLFKTADKNYKMDLLVGGMIESIIKLPQNLLPSTAISVNLIVLSKKSNNELKFVDATKEFVKENFKNRLLVDNVISLINGPDNDKVRTMKYTDILDNDAILSVDNYVGQKEIVFHNPHKLSEYIIDRFRGYQMTSSQQKELESPNGKYEVLTISDIDNGNISDSLTKINIDDNKLDRYLVENGDIIISSKGTRIKIAVAEIGDRKIIANGNLIVLRIDQKKLNPYYLEMYLNSSDGQAILKQIQTGSVIISINPSRLETITISTLPFEEQNKIANKYKSKQKQIALAQDHIRKLENELDNFYEDEIEVLFD